MGEHELSSGVQELINRLREDGIAEGRSEAEKIVTEAHRHVKQIIDQAYAEADGIIKDAREEADHYRNSAHDAVQMAARDTV